MLSKNMSCKVSDVFRIGTSKCSLTEFDLTQRLDSPQTLFEDSDGVETSLSLGLKNLITYLPW